MKHRKIKEQIVLFYFTKFKTEKCIKYFNFQIKFLQNQNLNHYQSLKHSLSTKI